MNARCALRSPLCLLVIGAVLVGCGSSGDSAADTSQPVGGGERLKVVTAFYPLEEAVRRIGGDAVEVTSLTPVGVGPHDLEIEAKDLEELGRADLVVFIGRGFQPSVQKAVSQLPADIERLDVLDTVRLLQVDPVVEGVVGEADGEVLDGDIDPHVWVDPGRYIEMVTVIADALSAADPAGADAIAANTETYLADLRALDSEFSAGLANCASKALVTSHRAFGYLANRYGLKQLPIAGISPDEEPSPKSLEAVAKAAKAEGVTVIFFESLVPKKLADTVAQEIGASTDALNPIEGLTAEEIAAGESYASIQRTNLVALRKGLRCR